MATFSLKTKITTPLLAETVAWYRDLLAMEIVEQWCEPGDQGCILALSNGKAEAFLEIYQGPEAGDLSNLGLQFRVDNVAAFKAPDEPRFESSGPFGRPWGSSYLFFTDPNGISVVLFSGSSL